MERENSQGIKKKTNFVWWHNDKTLVTWPAAADGGWSEEE